MTPTTRVMIGAVAREVVTLRGPRVGLVISHNQVGAARAGYAGIRPYEIEGLAVPAWRDHMKRCSLDHDVANGYSGAMLDTDDERPYKHAARLKVPCEVGWGEDSSGELGTRLELALSNGVVVRAVSAWTGTKLRCGRNELNRAQASIRVRRLYAASRLIGPECAVRAHNCDWLSYEDLRHLRDRGVDEFNFAPELGFELTRVVCDLDLEVAEKLAKRQSQTREFARWHDTDWRYGGHYSLHQYRSMLHDRTLDALRRRTEEFVAEKLEIVS